MQLYFFYSLPLVIDFTNNQILNSQEFRNNSKVVLAYTLDKKKNGNLEIDQKYNEKDLLVDIYSLNNQETDSVRLDASTIKQLYEDTNYKLDDIRKNKLVKPIALTLLPGEIKMIESSKKEKSYLSKLFYL